jgi:predicted DNA-binding protein (MmcQ/YjbR family)
MNLDFLQQLCNNWPGVSTDVKWDNDFVFSVAEKMFCVCSLEPPLKIAFKVRDEEFEELSVREGFMPAPYMARNKWVLITNPARLNRSEWEEFVKQSYELVKSKLPKRTQDKLGETKGEKVQGTRYKARPTGSSGRAQERSKVKDSKVKRPDTKRQDRPSGKKAKSKTATKRKSK